MEDVVGEIGIAVRRDHRIGDQLDTRVVDPWPLEEPQQRQLGALDRQRRRVAKAAGRHHLPAYRGIGEQLKQLLYAGIGRDGRDPLAGEGFERAEAFAHARAGPDRPIEDQAAAGRVRRRVAGQEEGQPLVGERVLGLAAQTGAGDDRAEADDQPQAVRLAGGERGKQVPGAGNLGAQRLPQALLVQIAKQARRVAAGGVQQRGDRPQRRGDALDRGLHRRLVGHVGAQIERQHAGAGHAREIGGQLEIGKRVGAAKDRQPGAAGAGKGQHALGADALAAAGDQQDVLRPKADAGDWIGAEADAGA